jgi:cardiolipin synthase
MNHTSIRSDNAQINARPHVLSGSGEFMVELEFYSKSAANRFFVQVMTFEGDRAGKQLIELMIASPAHEKLLVVDHYSDVVVNDTLLHLPPGIFNKSVWNEQEETQKLLNYAKENGIIVARTNPVGWFYARYPFRNHKKCIVIDDQIFTGGINFSDHNFAWHDMMIRLHSSDLAEVASFDIRQNSKGIKTAGIFESDDLSVVYLNRYSESEYGKIFSWIRQAKKSITVLSPYLSEPFLSVMKSISDRVMINIVIPGQNNKGIFTEYLKRESRFGWFNLFEFPDVMSHLKAILIDDDHLIFGSSNFDFISYLFEEEIIVKTTSSQTIGEFKETILNPLLNSSLLLKNPMYNPVKSYIPGLLWNLLRVSDPKSNLDY